ncbi:MAG: enoyl-CoA hydratase/isomerase family protein [Thermoplasmata archaeon]|nr:enoyl-CoA hydratase/isomerase family protein [Thermoplasmata archaeon]
MESELVIVERKGNVSWLILNRPEKKNALTISMTGEIFAALESADADTDVRMVVLTGAGKAFSAGGDIMEMASAEDKPHSLGELAEGVQRCVRKMRSMLKPVLVAVNGHATGAGLALVLGGDLVLASESATFNTGFIRIGLAPGCGTFFLSRLVGYQRACEMVFFGDTFDAEEAYEMGLVNTLVKPENLEAKAMKWAEDLEGRSAEALGMSKRLLNQAYLIGLDKHFVKERNAISETAGTEFFEDKIEAFLHKRKN